LVAGTNILAIGGMQVKCPALYIKLNHKLKIRKFDKPLYLLLMQSVGSKS
jgi:hypothetical protein